MKKEEIMAWKERLIEAARKAAKRAVSYRGFIVGAAALAVNEEGDKKIFLGANAKPLADGPKVCAEQVAVMSAIANGYRVIAIAVTGNPQKDGDSGQENCTLHPCYLCRNLLSSLLPLETTIFTAHNCEGPEDTLSLGQILEIHSK